MYISDIKKLIEKEQKKAEYAVKETTEKFVRLFENIDFLFKIKNLLFRGFTK